jgi:signal transduction histidine kinase
LTDLPTHRPSAKQPPATEPRGRSVTPLSKTGSLYAFDAKIPRYPRRFRWRVIGYILFISLLTSGVAFGFSYLRQAEFMRLDRHERGRTLSQTLAEGADLGVLSDEPALLAGAADRLLASSDVEFVEVYRLDGSRLLRRARESGGDSGAPGGATVKSLLVAKKPFTVVVEGTDLDSYYSPILVPVGDAVLAAYGAESKPRLAHRVAGYVRVGVNHLQSDNRQSEMLLWSIYLAGGLLGLGLILALLVGWRLSRPILKLAAGADAIRQGNLDVQVDIRSHDELGQLADSFNRMVWKLKATVDKLADLNRNLESEVNERTRDIRGMADFVKLLNARRDLQLLVTDALKSLMESTGSAVGAIFLYNDQAATLSVQAASGVAIEAFGPAIVKLGEGAVGNAAQQTEPVLVTDEQENRRLSSALGRPVQTVLHQRIRFAQSLAGVIVVGSVSTIGPRQRDVVAQAINQLAIAIANARAFGAAERLATELETRNIELTKQTTLLAEQKAQLEEMNRLKSELMANITHELRTPLNAVIGYAELMEGGAYGELNVEQLENLGAIIESARGLLNLITQILDMAKMEAGQMGLVVSEVDLVKLLTDAAQTAQVLAREKSVTVGLGVPEGGLMHRTDDGKLQQIVTNLVSNAVKFTEEGRVDLLATRRSDGKVQVLVRDSGVGIEPAQQSIIFDEFRQADGSTTRNAMGTGLGLAISQKFARLMGGDISVKSALGEGSTFTLTLPAEPPAAVEAKAEANRLDDVSQALGFSTAASSSAPGMLGAEGSSNRAKPQPKESDELELSLSLLDDGLVDDS